MRNAAPLLVAGLTAIACDAEVDVVPPEGTGGSSGTGTSASAVSVSSGPTSSSTSSTSSGSGGSPPTEVEVELALSLGSGGAPSEVVVVTHTTEGSLLSSFSGSELPIVTVIPVGAMVTYAYATGALNSGGMMRTLESYRITAGVDRVEHRAELWRFPCALFDTMEVELTIPTVAGADTYAVFTEDAAPMQPLSAGTNNFSLYPCSGATEVKLLVLARADHVLGDVLAYELLTVPNTPGGMWTGTATLTETAREPVAVTVMADDQMIGGHGRVSTRYPGGLAVIMEPQNEQDWTGGGTTTVTGSSLAFSGAVPTLGIRADFAMMRPWCPGAILFQSGPSDLVSWSTTAMAGVVPGGAADYTFTPDGERTDAVERRWAIRGGNFIWTAHEDALAGPSSLAIPPLPATLPEDLVVPTGTPDLESAWHYDFIERDGYEAVVHSAIDRDASVLLMRGFNRCPP